MRKTPFETESEIAEYLSGNLIQCLECGQEFRQITGKHLRLKHGMTHDDYREKWGLPRSTALASRDVRGARSRITRKLVADGILDYNHLPVATEAARLASRPGKRPASAAAQSQRMRENRPGDHSKIDDGGRRLDGRDADRARAYQRAYRAQKAGDPEPMNKYRRKYQ